MELLNGKYINPIISALLIVIIWFFMKKSNQNMNKNQKSDNGEYIKLFILSLFIIYGVSYFTINGATNTALSNVRTGLPNF